MRPTLFQPRLCLCTSEETREQGLVMKDKITSRTLLGMLRESQAPFERVQKADIAVWFLGASPVVCLAGSTAVPACSACTPLAVPRIEANNAETGCHG